MARARGANAAFAVAFSTAGYGTVPLTGFRPAPVVSIELGEEQDLIDDDILGLGREEREAGLTPITAEGPAVVPVDLRNFGLWLRALLGDPASIEGLAAKGTLTFSGLPANDAVVTINGVAVTFVTSGADASADEVNIGATVAEAAGNLVSFLNQSDNASIAAASYSLGLDGKTVTIVHDTLGTGGNAFTLVAGTSPASNAVASGATLAGGAATGAFNHIFTSGQLSLPDLAVQISNPEVPSHRMNWGVMVDSMSIQGQRTGLLNASLQLVAQGEQKGSSSMAGTLEDPWEVERFSQFTGQIEADGVPLARLESFTLRAGNNLDKDESIRRDGRIGGADPAKSTVALDMTLRFADTVMQEKAEAGTPLSLVISWYISATKRLDFIMEHVRLPRRKIPLSGPGGVRVTYPARALKKLNNQNALRVVLVNDVESY